MYFFFMIEHCPLYVRTRTYNIWKLHEVRIIPVWLKLKTCFDLSVALLLLSFSVLLYVRLKYNFSSCISVYMYASTVVAMPSRCFSSSLQLGRSLRRTGSVLDLQAWGWISWSLIINTAVYIMNPSPDFLINAGNDDDAAAALVRLLSCSAFYLWKFSFRKTRVRVGAIEKDF